MNKYSVNTGKKQVFIIYAMYYHLYVSLLEAYRIRRTDPDQELYLVITDYVPDPELWKEKVSGLGLFNEIFIVKDLQANKEYSKPGNVIKRTFFRKKLLTVLFRNDLTDNLKKALEHAEINLFFDTAKFSNLLYLIFPDNYYRLYEDGERLYMQHKEDLKQWIKYYILGYPLKYGRDRHIREMLVQRPGDLPSTVRHKGKKLDLEELVRPLSEEARRQIAGLFLDTDAFAEAGDSRKRLLLIPQPLSEDGYVSEEYKVEMYRRILREYGDGYQIWIKPHPREKTCYSDYFNAEILPGEFPLEILNLVSGFYFDRGITLFSSALNNSLLVKEKIFLGIDWDQTVAAAYPFKTIKARD